MRLFDKFTRGDEDEDDGHKDYFEDDIRTEVPKPVKEPTLPPDDPGYWEREEGEWDHLRPRRRLVLLAVLVALLLVVGLITGFYLRFFSPYIDEAVEYGYIEHVERRGTIFHTYEGVMIPYRELHDTTRVYRRDFIFSADAHTAKRLKMFELRHQPVMVSYKQYHATLPWRGASKIVITAVDSVDATRILPPEFRPQTP